MKLNLHPKVIPKDTPPAPLTKGGVVVGMKKEGDKEKIYFVGDDCHLLCVGATRSGKSRCLVLESICLLGLAGESIFCSDPKAELFHYTSEFLKKLGYEVLVLDFKNPAKSMRYNLLQPVIDAINEGDTDRAEMLAWDLTNNLVGKPEGEKIWTNGECSIIAAAILCVVCDNQKRPEFQNMTNVYWFISEMCRTIGNKMPLLEYLKKQSPTHPARALLSISDVAPSRTRGSFYTSALTTLRLFTSKSIYAITHTSDFTLSDLGTKKQALFVILPDEKTTFYPIASLIVSQQYELLAEAADRLWRQGAGCAMPSMCRGSISSRRSTATTSPTPSRATAKSGPICKVTTRKPYGKYRTSWAAIPHPAISSRPATGGSPHRPAPRASA